MSSASFASDWNLPRSQLLSECLPCAVFKVRARLPLALRASRSYAGRYPSEPAAASRMLRILPRVLGPSTQLRVFASANPQNDTEVRVSVSILIGLTACFAFASPACQVIRRLLAGYRPKDSIGSSPPQSSLPRKEVIQPHLPIRLPCYDFTPVIGLTFGSWLTDFGCSQLPWCDGRCVQGPGTYSPRHADPRLLATPTSCGRVAAHNPNWDDFFEIRSTLRSRSSLLSPL